MSDTIFDVLIVQKGSSNTYRVTWLYTPRGGYGYTMPLDARVLKVTAKRVVIGVRTRDGREVTRTVRPERLRAAN